MKRAQTKGTHDTNTALWKIHQTKDKERPNTSMGPWERINHT